MNSVIEDMADLLAESSSLGLASGTNLFMAHLPDTESEEPVIALFESPGGPPDPNDIENSMVQVLCRGTRGGFEGAWDLIQQVAGELHGQGNMVINGTNYLVIWKANGPFQLGSDAKGRPLLAANFRVKRT